MDTKISVNLPISWCQFCKRMDLKANRFITNGEVYETTNVCENAPICEACEQARKSEPPEHAAEEQEVLSSQWQKEAEKWLKELDEKISKLKIRKVTQNEGPCEIKGPDPYTEAANVVEAWCKKNYYDHFLVTLELDGELTTQLLMCETEDALEMVWDVDWYEGEPKIRVMGFRPICDFHLYGAPPEEK